MQLLSVIVPVYNTEKYIRKCIETILQQTYQNIELILVDDGSTDHSALICEEYREKDSRVVVIHTENKGSLRARLFGAELAKGEYIAFVDSDDWICTDTYERVMALGCADVISFGIIRYFPGDKFYPDYRMEEKIYDKNMIKNIIIPQMLWNKKINTCGVDPSLCTKIFRRKLLLKYIQKAQKLEVHYGEDAAVLYPLLLDADILINTTQCFYYHRQRAEGVVWPYFDDDAYFDKLYKLYAYLRDAFLNNEAYAILQNQLDQFYRYSVAKKNVYDNTKNAKEEVFPYWEFQPSSKVVLYGAGELGRIYKTINDQYHFCNIVLWVDQASSLTDGSSMPQSVDCIENTSYDAILIAVRNSFVAEEIRNELTDRGILPEKILWRSVVVSALK